MEQVDVLEQKVANALQVWKKSTEAYAEQRMQSSSVSDPSHHTAARPWSKSDFEARKKTFHLATWHGKGAGLDNEACAKHGWVNSGEEQLECRLCARTLTYQDPPSSDHVDLQLYRNKFKSNLNLMHHIWCPWRGVTFKEADVKESDFDFVRETKDAQATARRITERLDACLGV